MQLLICKTTPGLARTLVGDVGNTEQNMSSSSYVYVLIVLPLRDSPVQTAMQLDMMDAVPALATVNVHPLADKQSD